MWNADALIKSQLKHFYNQICRVIYFSVHTSSTDILLLPKQRQEKSDLPTGVVIGTLSNGNKLRTLADLITQNDMLLAVHWQTTFSLTTMRQTLVLDACEPDLNVSAKTRVKLKARELNVAHRAILCGLRDMKRCMNVLMRTFTINYISQSVQEEKHWCRWKAVSRKMGNFRRICASKHYVFCVMRRCWPSKSSIYP